MCLSYKHMKPIVRIKTIKGKEYWYEDTPYYDPEKKQIRHKSRYLGKNINGTPVKVRTEGIPGIAAVPTEAHTHGNLLPLLDIIRELRIDAYLAELTHERERETILALACNRIVRPLAMHQVATWYEESSLVLTHPDLPLSSQSISELLAELGTSGVPEKFMERLVRNLSTDSTLIYDITSLSSYSQFISLLEYGYNRDGLELPQVNFSLILDTAQAIPVMYDLYPGSIVDVVTLKNTLHRIRSLGVKNYTLILDRGFFSQGNLEELLEEQLSFVIPASLTLKAVKEVLTAAQRDLASPQYPRNTRRIRSSSSRSPCRSGEERLQGSVTMTCNENRMNGTCSISASMTPGRNLSRCGFPGGVNRKRCSGNGPDTWRTILRGNGRMTDCGSRSGTMRSRNGSTEWESRSSWFRGRWTGRSASPSTGNEMLSRRCSVR